MVCCLCGNDTELKELTKDGEMESLPVHSIESLISDVIKVTRMWGFADNTGRPWFRGTSSVQKHRLLPSVFRSDLNGVTGQFDEFNMTTMFRNRSPVLGGVPHRYDQDQWLFLMQHYGLPTRLLDWTENVLAALFFAVDDTDRGLPADNSVVWLLHPIELNKQTVIGNTALNGFPNTWTPGNIGNNYVQLSFFPEADHGRLNASYYPIAIQPIYSDARQRAQDSCFTIHGLDKRAIDDIFDNNSNLVRQNFLKKYVICKNACSEILSDLKARGITRATLYPDLTGLAAELKHRFFIK